MKYKCNVCNAYEYDSDRGDEKNGILAGTNPEHFPDTWKCPICQADKTHQIKQE